jgi:hypothetical protein
MSGGSSAGWSVEEMLDRQRVAREDAVLDRRQMLAEPLVEVGRGVPAVGHADAGAADQGR